jgi:hypothetical protein
MREETARTFLPRRWRWAVLAGVVACGDDPSGPEGLDYSGTYPGELYAIITSTGPGARDSISAGAATLTLTWSEGDRYNFSATSGAEGLNTAVAIDQNGAMGFPGFVQQTSLDFLSSVMLGLCDFSAASATPSGSVVNEELTVSVVATGVTCDWSLGSGADVRPTDVQLTWTGNKS